MEHFRRWAAGLVLDNGKRWKLEPFQLAFVKDLFSGKPECWLIVPEGNGKTTLVAGLALYHCQFTPDAYVAVAGSARDQAQVLYRQAEGFVFRSGLRGPFKCLEGYRRINYAAMNSRIQVYAADAGTGDGVIPTLAILDELHRHRSLDLYLTWSGKLDKRAGQVIAISTAGEPGSEFEQARERIRQATKTERDGCLVRARSETTVMHEWAVPEDGDIEDVALVASANPYSGVTEESLRRKRTRPTMTVSHWRRFNCNLPTRSEEAAISEALWQSAYTDERIPEGVAIGAGLDLGFTRDYTALVPLWVRDKEFRLLGPATILEPPKDGHISPYLVEKALRDLHDRNPLTVVVMDPSRSEQLAEWIRAEFDAEVIERQQLNNLAKMDYARFMDALARGQLHHCGDEGLTRHALNALAIPLSDGGTKFGRDRSFGKTLQPRRVIDALIAAAMAHTTLCAEFYADEVGSWAAF